MASWSYSQFGDVTYHLMYIHRGPNGRGMQTDAATKDDCCESGTFRSMGMVVAGVWNGGVWRRALKILISTVSLKDCQT